MIKEIICETKESQLNDLAARLDDVAGDAYNIGLPSVGMLAAEAMNIVLLAAHDEWKKSR